MVRNLNFHFKRMDNKQQHLLKIDVSRYVYGGLNTVFSYNTRHGQERLTLTLSVYLD